MARWRRVVPAIDVRARRCRLERKLVGNHRPQLRQSGIAWDRFLRFDGERVCCAEFPLIGQLRDLRQSHLARPTGIAVAFDQPRRSHAKKDDQQQKWNQYPGPLCLPDDPRRTKRRARLREQQVATALEFLRQFGARGITRGGVFFRQRVTMRRTSGGTSRFRSLNGFGSSRMTAASRAALDWPSKAFLPVSIS